jgi:dihydropyrimidinase
MTELLTVLEDVDAVLPHGRERVDIGISRDGRIAALARAGTLQGDEVLATSGLMALPGGLDLHVHISTFFGGTTTRDDFFTGTAAALFGGTTTVGQFAMPRPGETTAAAIARTKAEAIPLVAADLVIHGCIVRDTFDASLAELGSVASAGIRTVKCFSAYTDVIGLSLEQIHQLLRTAADQAITVFVHAETASLVEEGIEEAIRRGELGPIGHATSRTPLAEADAVRRISDLALETGATVYFVHISSAPGVAALAARPSHRDRILAETCPHYLFLDESVYEGRAGARWICSPPIRSSEHRAALWAGLNGGVLDTVSSDHNCFDTAQKGPPGTDFRLVPNGLPGIEHRLPLLVGAAVEGQMEWTRLAQVAAENPARIVGLWPRKGCLAVGADADIVLVDPDSSTNLGFSHMATDFSPYEGMRVPGRIERVYRRGEPVVAGGRLAASPGSGWWLPLRTGPVGMIAQAAQATRTGTAT